VTAEGVIPRPVPPHALGCYRTWLDLYGNKKARLQGRTGFFRLWLDTIAL